MTGEFGTYEFGLCEFMNVSCTGSSDITYPFDTTLPALTNGASPSTLTNEASLSTLTNEASPSTLTNEASIPSRINSTGTITTR